MLNYSESLIIFVIQDIPEIQAHKWRVLRRPSERFTDVAKKRPRPMCLDWFWLLVDALHFCIAVRIGGIIMREKGL